MNWLEMLTASAPAIISGIFAGLSVSQNKKAKAVVATIAPHVQTILAALPNTVQTVQSDESVADKVADVAQTIGTVAAPFAPEVVPIATLISTLARVADSLEAHTAAITAQKQPEVPK